MSQALTLVFDLDGTLSDPALGVIRCMNYALTSFDYSPLPDRDITRHIGPPLEQTIAHLTGTDDPEHIDAVAAAYRERYGDIGFRENTVYDGVPEMLQQLLDADYRLGVCTSKLQINAQRVIDTFNLNRYFDFINGSSGHVGKTEQLSELLAQQKIDAASIMIGDRAVDLVAAHSNGMQSIGVLWGYGSRSELQSESPRHLFQTPEELANELSAPMQEITEKSQQT